MKKSKVGNTIFLFSKPLFKCVQETMQFLGKIIKCDFGKKDFPLF